MRTAASNSVAPSVLELKARELLRKRPRDLTYDMIAKEIKVSPNWIVAFANEIIPDASVRRVERLYVYLAGRELVL